MFQSIIIAGGTPNGRMDKAVSLFPQGITVSSPDFINVIPEKSIGIEEVRHIKKQTILKPFSASYKAIVITDAHLLTEEAQSALLKILEEPPVYIMIFLLTQNTDYLLPTILSRCQLINLKEDINNLVPADKSSQIKFFQSILKGNPSSRLILSQEAAEGKEEMKLFLEKHILFLRSCLLNNLDKQNEIVSNKIITKIIRSCLSAKILLDKNINPKLCLDNLFLSYPHIS